jgi:hypothetical protein
MTVEKKIERINTLKFQVDALISKKDWDRNFFEQLKIDFTHVTNKIEGNAYEYGQTLRLLRDLVVPRHASIHNDYKEVRDLFQKLCTDKKISDLCVPVNSGLADLFG